MVLIHGIQKFCSPIIGPIGCAPFVATDHQIEHHGYSGGAGTYYYPYGDSYVRLMLSLSGDLSYRMMYVHGQFLDHVGKVDGFNYGSTPRYGPVYNYPSQLS